MGDRSLGPRRKLSFVAKDNLCPCLTQEGSLATTSLHSHMQKQSMSGSSYIIRSVDNRLLRHHDVMRLNFWNMPGL